ncbi:hypothetical protein DSL72_008558 [Monilinia vaccinii-corymbosi]|uniref:Rhodopsin domain-containing protein n=1 Tax=Monilinia vaccinii-corymbosi TaxID=61207 RepID=A0A8A3PQN5_9HELO|nr:hypothetical protein DSL72_008558 [Monilinia vaccinii-corymbosi]
MYYPPEPMVNWPAPNYENPVTFGPILYIVHAVLYPLAVIMLGLRTYTRLYITKSFGLDDILALISIIPITGFAILSMLVVSPVVGWNVHAWDARFELISLGLKFVYWTQILFTLGIVLVRISMLWFIIRLFQSAEPRLRRFTYGVLIYMVLHGSIFMLTLIIPCSPISDYWKVSLVPQENCINQPVNLIFSSITNAISDFLVVVLPLTTVYKLQVPFGQRVYLFLLFAVGFLASSASVVRTVYIYVYSVNGDGTWFSNDVYIWCSVEIYLGLSCACMPPSVGFWKLYYPKVMGTIARSEPQISKASRFWSSKTESKREQTNLHELADTDDEERGITVERGVTVETHIYSKGQLMALEGSCTAMSFSPPVNSSDPQKL